MAKEYKPGFIYIKSDLLKQEVAVSKKTGWVFCEDGVKYSPAEIDVIAAACGVLDPMTHSIKKIIGGEVVEVTKSAAASAPESVSIVKEGELDIY